MNKTFSIVVPIYKVEKYIAKCIESILSQTYKDFELICIDDCGGDKSLEIVQEYAKYDNRITILCNEQNRGVAHSRNRGIDQATGKYIMFIDSDDWIEPNTLEIVLNAFKEANTNSIIFDGYYFDQDMQKRRSGSILSCVRGPIDYTPNKICHGSDYLLKAYKTSTIKEHNIYYPEGINFEDGEFYFKYFSLNPKTFALDDKLYNYRVREGSIVNNAQKGNLKLEDIYTVVKHLRDFYIENGLYSKYKKTLLQLMNMRINTCRNIRNNYEISLQNSKDLLDTFNYPEEFSEFRESQTPFFSIIVPFYNVENYIHKCLRSIQAQTFTNFEIICVDDRGDDDSYLIVKEIAKNDKRIKIVRHKKNESLGSARNTGLKHAKGQYIICVDSDDYILPNCLEVVFRKIQETSLNTIWFKFKIWWEDSNQITDMSIFPGLQNHPEGYLTVTPENIINFPVTTWNKAYNREFLLKNNIWWPEKILYEDNEFYFRVMIADPETYVLDDRLLVYTRRRNSIMGESVGDINKAKQSMEVTRRIYEFLKDSGNLEKYGKAFLRFILDINNNYRYFPKIQTQLYPYMKELLEQVDFPNSYMNLKD